jgi:hypothetical protein
MPLQPLIDAPRPGDWDKVRLAHFTVAIATQLCGAPDGRLRLSPDVKWFDPLSHPALHHTRGQAPKDPERDRWIRLATDLEGDELISVALHEVKHYFQPRWFSAEPEALGEIDANAFAARWSPAVRRLYRAAGGFSSGVRIVEDRLPALTGLRHGQLVLVKDSRKVFRYNARTMGSAWEEIR